MQLRQNRKNSKMVSLQECIENGKDGTTLTVEDAIPDPFRMEDAVEREDVAGRLRAVVAKLEGRDRQVIALRYGMDGGEPLTQQETAAILGISRSYVSRLENRILERLQQELGGTAKFNP